MLEPRSTHEFRTVKVNRLRESDSLSTPLPDPKPRILSIPGTSTHMTHIATTYVSFYQVLLTRDKGWVWELGTGSAETKAKIKFQILYLY